MVTWETEAEERAVADARADDTLAGVIIGIVLVAAGLAVRGLQLWACGL